MHVCACVLGAYPGLVLCLLLLTVPFWGYLNGAALYYAIKGRPCMPACGGGSSA